MSTVYEVILWKLKSIEEAYEHISFYNVQTDETDKVWERLQALNKFVSDNKINLKKSKAILSISGKSMSKKTTSTIRH